MHPLVSGRPVGTGGIAATPAPDHRAPPKAPPSPARASHPKRLAPLQRIGAAFMPGQSGRVLSLAPALKGEADSRVMVASSVQLTAGSMWFDGSLVFITEVVGLLDVPCFRRTRLQFSPFLQRRSAKAVKTRRLSDYMAHLTLSPCDT